MSDECKDFDSVNLLVDYDISHWESVAYPKSNPLLNLINGTYKSSNNYLLILEHILY